MTCIHPYGAPEAASFYAVSCLSPVFYLVTEHTAYVLGALPFLLLLSCPLMHLFMHHGHGGHGGHDDASRRSNPPNVDREEGARHDA
jgi:hypothetical protein